MGEGRAELVDLPEGQVRVVVLETEHETSVISATVGAGGLGSASDNSSVDRVVGGRSKFMLQVVASGGIRKTVIQPARSRKDVDLEVKMVGKCYQNVGGEAKLLNFGVVEERIRQDFLKKVPKLVDAVVGCITQSGKKAMPSWNRQMGGRMNSETSLERRSFMNV